MVLSTQQQDVDSCSGATAPQLPMPCRAGRWGQHSCASSHVWRGGTQTLSGTISSYTLPTHSLLHRSLGPSGCHCGRCSHRVRCHGECRCSTVIACSWSAGQVQGYKLVAGCGSLDVSNVCLTDAAALITAIAHLDGMACLQAEHEAFSIHMCSTAACSLGQGNDRGCPGLDTLHSKVASQSALSGGRLSQQTPTSYCPQAALQQPGSRAARDAPGHLPAMV